MEYRNFVYGPDVQCLHVSCLQAEYFSHKQAMLHPGLSFCDTVSSLALVDSRPSDMYSFEAHFVITV